MAASFWCACRAVSQPLVLVLCISARSEGQLTDTSPMEMTSSRYRATCVLNSWTSILQSSRVRWVLLALSEPLPLRSHSPPGSGGLLIWKIEERVADRPGRFLRPFGAELMHTHPPSPALVQCAPRAARSSPCARPPAEQGAERRALTGLGLGLGLRVGNLQPGGEPAASLPAAAGEGEAPPSSSAQQQQQQQHRRPRPGRWALAQARTAFPSSA